MLIRLALVLALVAAPAAAAPLCRDLKGLYTPCPTGKGAPTPQAARQQKIASATDTAAAASTIAPGVEKEAPSAEKGRSLVSHSKALCRDTKGLYTPCPR
jgi:hypothetical protein